MRDGGSARLAAIFALVLVACGGTSVSASDDDDPEAGESGSGGSGGSPTRTIVDVSGHSGVTRMFVDYISDGGGIGWDDFTFVR